MKECEEMESKTITISIKDYEANVKTIYIQKEVLDVIHECIDLLKQEGRDTKQQVLEKLEELVK